MNNPNFTSRWLRPLAVVVGAVILESTIAPSANAEPQTIDTPSITTASDDGVMDPATFEGPVLIATEAGEIFANVQSGELLEVAAEIRADVAAGVPTVTPRGTCSVWHNAVGLPTGYADSLDGCAVFGYPGYIRHYSFENKSDVQLCVRGRGYSASGVVGWWALGCNSNHDVGVPWGNVLAATKVGGKSLSGVTGAAYVWWA